MTEERLKEIKDSISYAHIISCDPAISMDFRDKEDLYYEVIRLRENNNKVIDLIEPLVEWGECTINGKMLKAIYDILKENKE